ncbi:phage portal protein [Williamsia serinedens]|uniref:Phage portal protein, SPP1 Gp6-like n=1 Tax=Williamsia serinedens TaxID=391736 RepID=A0ABT1H6W3_9NOCA|nr:phage portal protein [Williamsia serinedens]MCP2162669.1 Phage portal protein, SPP1 Gp6-like [Williamsia serinedens]
MSDAAFSLSIPGLTDDEQRTVRGLFTQLQAKRNRNLLRSAYYEGKHALRVASPVVPDHYYKLGIVLGWSAKAVDALAQRTALETVDWPDGDIDSLGLPQLVDANQLRATFKGGQVNSLLHGVSWVVNTVGARDEPSSLIHVKDALSATGTWNARSRRLTDFLSITSLDDEGNPNGIALYLPNLVVQCDKAGGRWSIARSQHRWGIPVEPMAYKPWTREFGASRLTRPLMSLQDRALNALIRLEGHMDVYSFPEFWMLGADSSVFKNPDGSLKPIVQVMLGRIKGIPDDDTAPPELARADVKQFPGNSPTPHLAALNGYAKLFARESGLPDSAMAITDYANPTSADAYAESREDLIADAEGATDDWSVPIRRSVARGLAIQNGLTAVPDEWATMAPRWRSPLFQSRAAQADAGTKVAAAVPDLAATSVGLRLMGLSDEDIRQFQAERRRVNGGSVIDRLRARAGAVNDAGNANGTPQPAGQPQ